MKYRVVHVTSYRYDEPVALSHNAARLAPRNSALQLVGRCVVEVSPAPAVMHRYVDYFGNTVDSFALQVPHVALTITATTEVEVLPRSPISTADAARAPAWETLAAQDAWLPIDVAEHRFESPMVPTSPDLARFARESFHPGRPVLDAALALNHAIYSTFTYDPAATTVNTPVSEVLQKRHGVCQDFSHVMVGALRSIGVPARYVSGYLETLPPEGQQRLVGADASHAWVQVYCGADLGFVDLDPTNDCIPGEHHITVGYGRDFSDVSPVKGMTLGGGTTHVKVGVDVERLPD